MALDSGIGENIGVVVELRMIFVCVKENIGVVIELRMIFVCVVGAAELTH